MNRTATFLSMIVLALGVASSGCVEVNQTMTIDGNRGTFTIIASVPKAVADTVSKDSPYAVFFDTHTGAAHFNRPGVVARNYRVYSNRKGDRKIIKVRGEITDLKKALASGVLGNFTLGKGKKGKRLECILAKAKPSDMAARKDAFKGVSLNVSISVAGTVLATNGKQSDKTVSWDLAPDKLKDTTLYLEYE